MSAENSSADVSGAAEVTRADGGSATTQAADIDSGSARWHARPLVGGAIRVAIFLFPAVVSIIATRVFVVAVPLPDPLVQQIAYWSVALGISIAAMVITERLARRLTPLATLFTVSLVFPDAAPSRFRTALRSGSVRKFEERLAAGEVVAPQEAATALLGLVTQVGKHDRLTRGHSERVRAFTDMLSEELGLPDDDRDKLRWAALVHDVGKLSVPPEILNKPGRPTEEEWEVLRNHPAEAAELIEPLRPWLGDWALAATEHHERYDGAGYPAGLAADEISLAGRIVAVADAYDVMTAARSYKKPLSPAVAREELTRNAGSQFDPVVVRAMLNISMGRLRFVVGPLGWLSELAWIIRIPQAATTAAGGAATAASAAATAAIATFAPIGAGPPPLDPLPAERIVAVDTGDVEEISTTTSVPPGAVSTDTRPEEPRSDEPEATSAPTTVAPTTSLATTTTSGVVTTTVVTTTTVPTTTTAPTTTVPTTSTTAAGSPPTANPDSKTFGPAGGAIPVLNNDVAGSSKIDRSSVRITIPPPAGDVTTAGNTVIRFDPAGFLGTTQLTYEVCDEAGLCDSAVVTITVE